MGTGILSPAGGIHGSSSDSLKKGLPVILRGPKGAQPTRFWWYELVVGNVVVVNDTAGRWQIREGPACTGSERLMGLSPRCMRGSDHRD